MKLTHLKVFAEKTVLNNSLVHDRVLWQVSVCL